MTNGDVKTVRIGDQVRWIPDGTLGTVIELVRVHNRSPLGFRVAWPDTDSLATYYKGRISDLEYLERV